MHRGVWNETRSGPGLVTKTLGADPEHGAGGNLKKEQKQLPSTMHKMTTNAYTRKVDYDGKMDKKAGPFFCALQQPDSCKLQLCPPGRR